MVHIPNNNDGFVFVCEILENTTLDHVTINSLPIWFIYYNKEMLYVETQSCVGFSKCSHTKALRLL